MKKILKMQYKNIVFFELLYRFVFITMFGRLIYYIVNWLLNIYGYSFLTLKNLSAFFSEPLTYPALIFIIIIALIACGFEITVLYTGFLSSFRKEKISFAAMLVKSLKSFIHLLKPKNLPILILSGGMIILWNVFPLYRLGKISTKVLDVVTLLNTVKLAKVLLILLVSTIVVIVLDNMFSVTFAVFNKDTGRSARLKGRAFIKESYKKLAVRCAVSTVIYTVLYFFVYFLITFIAAVLIVLFTPADLEMALIEVVSGYINRVLLFLISVIAPMVYAGINVSIYEEKYDDVLPEQENDLGDTRNNLLLSKRIMIGALGIIIAGSLVNIADVIRNGSIGAENTLGEMSITAHRGFSDEAPENTLPALDLAAGSLADFAEIDIRQTKDHEIILMHDDNLKRTTGKDANVWELTYDEISRIDAGAGFSREYAGTHIPTLREALILCKGRINLNIEIKAGPEDENFIEDVMTLIDELDMKEQCIFCSTSYNSLKEIKKYDKNCYTGYIIPAAYGDYFEDPNVDFFSINEAYLNAQKVNKAHSYGKSVYAWTVNDEDDMIKMKHMGVDGIITDKPVYAREVIFGNETTRSLMAYLKKVLK